MRALSIAILVCMLVPSTLMAFEFETAMIEMRDGVHLATDVFRPSARGQFPTIFIRTPYGKGMIPDEAAEEICDGLKFVLIVQDTRGRYDSEGVDDVFMSDGWGENQDGYDSVDWLVAQTDWSDGKVGLFGASALGISAFMAIGALHPAILAAHIGITPWVFYDIAYQEGCFRNGLVVDWLEDQGSEYILELYKEHPHYDELWEGLDMRTRADDIHIPIYHWGGWYDTFAEGPHEAFEALRDPKNTGDTPHRLLMGPWTHTEMGAIGPVQGELTYPEDSIIPLSDANPISWFQRFLKGQPRSIFDERWPVRFYLMGDPDDPSSAGNRWILAKSWPIPSRTRVLYLERDGSLSWTAPLETDEPLSYFNDPADPSPTIGGRELSLDQGPYDQTPLLSRPDVLSFQTEPFTEPVVVVGMVKAEIFASSDGPDTDFTVRLVDVYPDGRAMLVTDGIAKARYLDGVTEDNFITPGDIVHYEIEVGSTALSFDKGHRLQVLVSSSNSRRFEPSRNNDDDIWGDEPARVALNSVYMDKVYPSQLILPEPILDFTRVFEGHDRQPSQEAVERARTRLARGARLSETDRDVLTVEGGKQLMEALLKNIGPDRR